jgi:transcriptional regulator with XRE-family HTH domain
VVVIQLSEIGKRIKEARLSNGFTQQELADKCGVTKSLLSKIENGQTASALATLSKIASNLNTPLSWFLDEEKDHNIVVLPNKSRTTKIGNKETHYMYETLANRSRFSKIEPLLITFLPDSEVTESFIHDEDEFMFVLSGSIKLEYDNETYLLQEGDSIYFKGSIPHIAYPLNNQEAKILCIFVQPTLN